jgi:Cd2+/Zn2+-exporting ATPase
MSVAAIAAFSLGRAPEALTIVFLYSISEALEGYTGEKTRHAIRALMKLTPKDATVSRDGRELVIPVDEIVVDDVFLLRPGQYVPTDGTVIAGSSTVNQAALTGESVPVDKVIGDTVFAGTLNERGALEVVATTTASNNMLARIIILVEEAQEKKGKSETFIRRFGRVYSPSVLLVGILLGILPALFDGLWLEWAVRATVFIVSASPCALVISIPVTMVSALGTSARRGVLIKGGVYLEDLAKVRVVAFDKTGTLTIGKPKVHDVIALNGWTENEVVVLAASVEQFSQHPLAQAILDEAKLIGGTMSRATGFQSHTSQGVSAEINGKTYLIGSPEWCDASYSVDVKPHDFHINSLRKGGKTVAVIASEGVVFGIIAIRDAIKPNARESVAALRAVGIEHIVMLTGDNATTAAAIALEAGVDEFFCDMKPEEKSATVTELEKRHGKVMMVGDGVNDAPALASATVGVAMGAAGTDVALETADVVLMGDDLEKLSHSLRLAKRARRVVTQNLVLSMIVITGLVIGSIFGGFTLPIAVVAHELSELLVITNGLRLMKV